MTRTSLARVIAQHHNITTNTASAIIETLQNAIKQTVIDGGTVELPSFLTIKPQETKERTGIHPLTKEEYVIPKRTRPHIKASKVFVNAVTESHR